MVKAKDDSEILVTYVKVYSIANAKESFVKLQGLKPGDRFKDEETGRIYEGDLLMHAGLPTGSLHGDFSSKLIHLVKIN